MAANARGVSILDDDVIEELDEPLPVMPSAHAESWLERWSTSCGCSLSLTESAAGGLVCADCGACVLEKGG